MRISVVFFTMAMSVYFFLGCSIKKESNVWVDPRYNPKADKQPIVVWFESQYLEDADSFMKKASAFKGMKRSAARKEVMAALRALNDASFQKIESDLNALEKEGIVLDIKRHWIINGFSCTVSSAKLDKIKALAGVAKIFIKNTPNRVSGKNMGPEFLDTVPENSFSVAAVESYPWNIEKIRAPEVWKEFGFTGKGVLNIVHDSGFKLDIPPLASNIYTNNGEMPGNGIDDDANGYIDDYHGYNFDTNSANLNEPNIRRATNIHGNLCAAIICGTYATNTKQAIGVAPAAQWAPLIGSADIEQAVEWAIEQGADTYSMSFSQPNLGEYRTHWRKVLEHGTLCGIVFISGAGNFASGPRAAQVPVQMRNPEDIPNVVLGVAGIGEDGQRPAFSSQGPVVWNTHYYKDGEVGKPDFTTLNFKIPCVDPEGNLANMANGNSLSGPHMAGIVALMFSANADLHPWEIKEILITAALDIGEKGFDFQSGHGFVNAYDAVRAVLDY